MGAQASTTLSLDGQQAQVQTSQVQEILRGKSGYQTLRFGAPGSSGGLFAHRPDQSMLFTQGPRQIATATPQLQLTETIPNDVNLNKPSLKLNRDTENPNVYCLEFVFDAADDCTMSIWYLAEESFDPANNAPKFETAYKTQPKTRQFKKGLGQRFVLDAEEGFDVTLVQNRGLMYYHQGSQRFPVVIKLQTCVDSPNRVRSQTTLATFRSNSDGSVTIAVIKQKIQVQGNAFELQEIYGIEQSEESENSKECVICMSAPKDTTVLPCRHMCMCSECAKVLRYQTNKCPICRCAVESLLQIKVTTTDRPTAVPGAA